MASLKTYRAKRDFSKTTEPTGKAARGREGRGYVIQKHDATRLHYDLRLELDGVMLSWAVTRGPSLVPGEKRLAIHVEDHPIAYNTFEGTIPKGEYGGGTVMIWDRGQWRPDHDPHKGLKKGHLDFELQGEKLHGHWHLVKMTPRPGERQEPWLLIKSDDAEARKAEQKDILDQKPKSVATGRTMQQIATGKSKVWHSNRPADQQSTRRVAPAAKTAPRKPSATSRRAAPKAAPADIPDARKAQLPGFVEPCLATLSATAPEAGRWMHEIKFDGYRIQARLARGKISLKTRTGLDWTKKFPSIVEALQPLAGHDAIIDGEIVSADAQGVSNFSALQDDLKNNRRDRLAYYVFDILHLDGFDLTGAALEGRRRALAALLANISKDGALRFSESFDVKGPVLLKHACQMKLEGVISKLADTPYRSGRSRDWLKTKCSSAQEFVVAGFAPSDVSPKRVRALVAAYYDGDVLRYAGRVGTGFTDKMRSDLWDKLEPLKTHAPPFDKIPSEERGRAVHWIKPRVVVEADFRGWTASGHLRQASYKGVREDKPAKQVVREVERMPSATERKTRQAALRTSAPKKTTGKSVKTGKAATPAAKRGVTIADVSLTHPERIYWDDAGVTKEMLAEYYEQVWDWMKPHVVGRVLSLVRCPDGQSGQCFYQKHASAGIDQTHLLTVAEPDGEKSIALDNLGGLIALVQAGVLEVHVRGSSTDRLEEADRLVFDLDPGPGVEWPAIVAAAREVQVRLQALKLESFVKTTGGKGLHVVLPIQPIPWESAKDFCRRFAEQMAGDSPALYTAAIKKTARDGRIFIDYLRNSREATAVAPYSTRARPDAPVSTPLSWQELGKQTAPNYFTVQNMPKRLARLRKDPWADIGHVSQKLPTPGRR